MHQEILRFLKTHNTDVLLINKLIVSLFIKAKGLTVKHNRLIKQHIIPEMGGEYEALKNFTSLFKHYEHEFDFGNLIELFEHSIPAEDRLINGIFYTPKDIKAHIVNEVFDRLSAPINQALFGDISCGCGGFLYTVAKKIHETTGETYFEIFKNHLVGLDIKPYSIDRAQLLLSLLALSVGEDRTSFEFNLFVGNALDFNWNKQIPLVHQNSGFDAIVGNPPYVTLRNIDEESRQFLSRWSVANVGNTDLYIPFFQIGLENLRENGILGYITVNTFLRSLNARTLRKYFHLKAFDFKIIDFGSEQVFGNRSTYTCLCFIQKRSSERIQYARATLEEIREPENIVCNDIKYHALDAQRGWVFCPGSTFKRLKAIEATGTSLVKRFKMRTGLATLKNHIYVFKPVQEDDTFYYIKENKTISPIEKAICHDIINPSRLHSDSDIPHHLEKIIFPYQRYKNKIELFKEDYFVTQFPYAYKYLQAHKQELAKRDKGKGKYQNWYAFGRTQSLIESGYKLLFPHLTTQPRFIFTSHLDLLFYNGHAIYSDSVEELLVLKIILESDVFNEYISYSSKPYANGYFSLSRNYIKHFGVCELSQQEKEFLLNCQDRFQIDDFLRKKYNFT